MSPDGSTKPLPEEKLLKLIRDKGPRAVTVATVGQAGGVGPSIAATSDAGRGVSSLRWPQLAAGGLGVLLFIEAVCLILQLARPLPTVHMPVIADQSAPEPSASVTTTPAMPSLAQSASPMLFTSPAASLGTPTTGSRPHGAPSASAKLLASRLTLMGIVAGEPAQAIIEDSQTKKTYFVTAGQAVVEGAVVEQVLDNRVILDLEGEKIELTL